MYKFPYETRAGAIYASSLKATVIELQRAISNRELVPLKTLSGRVVKGVLEIPPYCKHVPPVMHPIAVDNFGQNVIVVDTRPFVKNYREGDDRAVSNGVELQLAAIRAALTRDWADGAAADFLSFADFPCRVFTRMLSEAIVRRLGLNPGEQMGVAVLVAYYFLNQFYFEETLGADQLLGLASRISRMTAVPTEKVVEFIEPAGQMRNINDLIVALHSAIPSPRMTRLNEGLVFSMVTGFWWGADARLMVAMALEHPPTWFAIIYTALSDRSFHGSQLAKLCQQIDRNNTGKEFSRVFHQYIEGALNGQ